MLLLCLWYGSLLCPQLGASSLNYTIDIAPEPSGTLPMIISADTKETLGGLEPATTYTVSVRGMTAACIGDAAIVIVTTLPCEWQQ